MLSQPTMLVATRGADTLGGVPAPGYRLLRLPTVGTITGKLILVPKPSLPSSYPSEARQESRAGGLGPAAHRNSYEVVTTYRRGASPHHDQERYGAQDNFDLAHWQIGSHWIASVPLET